VLRKRPHALGNPGRPARILLLGGTSEIGLSILTALRAPGDTEVVLAGRDAHRLSTAAAALPYRTRIVAFDATALRTHEDVIEDAFAGQGLDMVISAAGVLLPHDVLAASPLQAGLLVEANFTGHVTTMLAAAERMRAQGHGILVILSSVAAVRPRRANFVYGSAKAGLDAFARGLADSLHGSGVRLLLVRPGFVTGRMTRGMPSAPLATTPAQVGEAVAAALARRGSVVWVPPSLGLLAVALRLIPRPAWRRLRR
jgi:decaprenylphospho-beta-D-erythro-pentofuranosid-2-ulose 2-reductase